jgi:hypothetical protein
VHTNEDKKYVPRGGVPGLGWLTDGDIDVLRRVDCNIMTQCLIELIEYSYHQGIPFFFGSLIIKNTGIKHV